MALNAILDRERPSWWQLFKKAPLVTLAKSLYAQRQRSLTAPSSDVAGSKLVVVCISDTHNSQPFLPTGDVLVHAGDLTQSGSVQELQSQLDWLDAQPHLHKVVIAGNHDIALDKQLSAESKSSSRSQGLLRWGSLIYLERSAVTLKTKGGRSLTLYGHPYTQRHGNWAFQYEKGTDVFTQRVVENVDVLITHAAPRFHLDVAGWGDEFLLQELWRVRPRLHVFGHIHEGYGKDFLIFDGFEKLYEQICAGNAGVLALLRMMLLLVLGMATGSSVKAQRTMLVNASAVGGLRDNITRKAQVISL